MEVFGHWGDSAGNAKWPSFGAAVLFAMLCGGAAVARAGEPAVRSTAGTYEVRAEFTTAAPPALVWEVLTDYEHIPAFVRAVRQSTVESRSGTQLRMQQVARAGAFAFRKTVRVTLDVREEPRVRIQFVDVLGRDFRSYAGSWSLTADSSATEVRYALALAPRAGVPGWLGRSVIRHSTVELLEDVRAEIERRAAKR
jgi:ribosome-associated toxin RatA of RatAB toxin-antitoxin module